jgi:hypothetical protein
MSYYNGSQIPLGTKMKDLNPRPKWLEDNAKSRGFNIGDLVLYKTMSYNAMTIYRIIDDCPSDGEALWQEYKAYPRSTYLSRGWVDPSTGKAIDRRLVQGHMVLLPAFSMEDNKTNRAPRKKKVPYYDMSRIKKIDILEIGRMFSKINYFLMSEAKRLSE